MSFFFDVMGDNIIGAGLVKLTATTTTYLDGLGVFSEKQTTFTACKSVQPLTPAEAKTLGFADYSTNEFITMYTLKKVPMPSSSGKTVTVMFNSKKWYVRKVLPWVWDEGMPAQQGYWEVTLSRFDENNINPD